MKKIALFGIHEQGLDIIRYLNKAGIKINCLVTIDYELSLKNQAAGWIDYSKFAEENNIQIYFCEKYSLKSEKDEDFFKKII